MDELFYGDDSTLSYLLGYGYLYPDSELLKCSCEDCSVEEELKKL